MTYDSKKTVTGGQRAAADSELALQHEPLENLQGDFLGLRGSPLISVPFVLTVYAGLIAYCVPTP